MSDGSHWRLGVDMGNEDAKLAKPMVELTNMSDNCNYSATKFEIVTKAMRRGGAFLWLVEGD